MYVMDMCLTHGPAYLPTPIRLSVLIKTILSATDAALSHSYVPFSLFHLT